MNIKTPLFAPDLSYTSICRSCSRERPVNLIGECLNCCTSAVEFFDSIMVRHERRVAAIERAHRWRMTLVAVIASAPLWVPAAMGGIKLKGTSLSKRFSRPEGTVIVGESISKGFNYTGGRELTSVPTSRAVAMRKILGCVFNAIAKARVDGFNEGRNLLKGLATGAVGINDFTEESDNAAAGKRPRYRF